MRLEYKGFYLERAVYRGNDCGYSLYHVVTGNYAGTQPTIKDAKDEIDSIHNDVRTYARFAGCHPVDLRLKYGRWVYDNQK